MFLRIKTITKLKLGYGEKFPMNIKNLAGRGSHSVNNARFYRFTLLF